MQSSDRICGVYALTNVVNHKVYVGKSIHLFARWRRHRVQLNHGNHGNPHLQHAWTKYGESAFGFSIIERVSDLNLLGARESWHVQNLHANDPTKGYNIEEAVADTFVVSNETKIKQGIAAKAAWQRDGEQRIAARQTPEYKEKMREASLARGYRHSPEMLTHLSKVHAGVPQSESHRRDRGLARLGHEVTEETRARIGDAHRGRKATEETKAKMSATRLGRKRGPMSDDAKAHLQIPSWSGKQHSPETKIKMADAARARWAKRKETTCPQT